MTDANRQGGGAVALVRRAGDVVGDLGRVAVVG